MKTTFLLLFICIITLTASAQKVAVAATKENVLWVGLPNPLIVIAEGYMCKDIVVTTSDGKLEPGNDDCEYTIYPEKWGKLLITVSSKKQPAKALGLMEFRVKRIPPPVARIGGKEGGEIRKPILQVQLGVVAALTGFDFDARFIVTKYTLTLTRGSNIYFSHNNKGAKFEQPVFDAFREIAVGDVLDVYDIDCVGPDRSVMRLQPIRFRVVE
jgi:hypothetical protein